MSVLTKLELKLFEDVIKCPRCLTSANICKYHAEKIRVILIEDIKIVIEQRIREEIISDPSNAEINSGK